MDVKIFRDKNEEEEENQFIFFISLALIPFALVNVIRSILKGFLTI